MKNRAGNDQIVPRSKVQGAKPTQERSTSFVTVEKVVSISIREVKIVACSGPKRANGHVCVEQQRHTTSCGCATIFAHLRFVMAASQWTCCPFRFFSPVRPEGFNGAPLSVILGRVAMVQDGKRTIETISGKAMFEQHVSGRITQDLVGFVR
jgi:hypothetical protein